MGMREKLLAAAQAAATEATTNERARCLWCADEVVRELREKISKKFLLSPAHEQAAKVKLQIAEAVVVELRRAIVSGVRPLHGPVSSATIIDEKPERPGPFAPTTAPEPAAPHADDEARIAVKLCEKAEGGTCGPEDALREAMELCNSLAAGWAKAEAELAKQTQRENEGVRIFDGIVADLRAKLAEAEKAHEQDQKTACADEVAYLNEIAVLKQQTRCPECGCASPEDAEAAECGCEAPVCMVPASSTLAREFVKALAERDAAVRDAKNAADMMVVANAEGLRYMRERDAALAAQNARAVKELQAIEKTLRNEWREADTTQCLKSWVDGWLRDRLTALGAVVDLDRQPEPAAEPAPKVVIDGLPSGTLDTVGTWDGETLRMRFTPAEPVPALNALLDKAKGHVMSDEEREAQRQSFVRGNLDTDRDDATRRVSDA